MTGRPSVGVDAGGTKLLLVAGDGECRAMDRAATGPEAAPDEIERAVRAYRRVRAGEAVAALGAARAAAGAASRSGTGAGFARERHPPG